MLKTLKVKALAPDATLLIFGIVITAKCEFREFHLLLHGFLRIPACRENVGSTANFVRVADSKVSSSRYPLKLVSRKDQRTQPICNVCSCVTSDRSGKSRECANRNDKGNENS